MNNGYLKKIASLFLTVFFIYGTVASILSAPASVKIPLLVALSIGLFLSIIFVIKAFFGKFTRVLKGARQVGLINLQKDRLHGSHFVKENLKNAKEVRLFGVSGNQAVPDYGEEFRYSLSNNASKLKVIFAMQGGLIYDEDIEAQKGSSLNDGIIQDVFESCRLLNEYLKEATLIANKNNRLVGTIEVGFFDIHNRVPMLICDESYAAFHLSLPPKRSNESVFFEVEGCEILKEEKLIQNLITHFDLNWNYLEKNSLTGVISDYKRLLDDFTQINIKANQALEQDKLTSGAEYYFNKKRDDRNLALGQDNDDIVNHHFGIGDIPQQDTPFTQEDIFRILNRLEIAQIETLIHFMGPIAKEHKILDAGCGRGGTSILINHRYGSNVTGINISEYQVGFANDIIKRKQLNNIDFKLMNYYRPDFSDNYFDHVILNEVTQYANNLPKLFAGFHRVLKQKGRITIATWCMKENYTDENWATKINEHYGLKMHTYNGYLNALTPLFKNVSCEDYSEQALPYFIIRDKWKMKSGVEPYYIEGFTTKKLLYAFITATKA